MYLETVPLSSSSSADFSPADVLAADVHDSFLVISNRAGGLSEFRLSGRSGHDPFTLSRTSPSLPADLCSLSISPSGEWLAVGDSQGWVRVYDRDKLLMKRSPPSPSPLLCLPWKEHRQHGGFHPSPLCWSTDSARLYSGCRDGLVVELSMRSGRAPVASALSSWSSSSATTVVTHCPRENIVQICAALSEVSCGLTDLLLVSTHRPQILLFHFPRAAEFSPRCAELVGKLPQSYGEVSYACCFSSARIASSIIIARSSKTGISIFFCTLNGQALQEFPLDSCLNADPQISAPLSCTASASLKQLRKLGTSNLLVASFAEERVLLLDLSSMRHQELPIRSAIVFVLSSSQLMSLSRSLNGASSASLAISKVALADITPVVPLSLLGEQVVRALRKLQRIFLKTKKKTLPECLRVVMAPSRGPDCEAAEARTIFLEDTISNFPLSSAPGQFTVKVAGNRGLGLVLGLSRVDGEVRVTVQSFGKLPDGSRGEIELSKMVEVGDRLVGVDDLLLASLGIEAAVEVLQSLEALGKRPEGLRLVFQYGDEVDLTSLAKESPLVYKGGDEDLLLDVFAGLDNNLSPRINRERSESEGGEHGVFHDLGQIPSTLPTGPSEVSWRSVSVSELRSELEAQRLYSSIPSSASQESGASSRLGEEVLQYNILSHSSGAASRRLYASAFPANPSSLQDSKVSESSRSSNPPSPGTDMRDRNPRKAIEYEEEQKAKIHLDMDQIRTFLADINFESLNDSTAANESVFPEDMSVFLREATLPTLLKLLKPILTQKNYAISCLILDIASEKCSGDDVVRTDAVASLLSCLALVDSSTHPFLVRRLLGLYFILQDDDALHEAVPLLLDALHTPLSNKLADAILEALRLVAEGNDLLDILERSQSLVNALSARAFRDFFEGSLLQSHKHQPPP